MITYDLVMTTTEEKPLTVEVKDLQEGEEVESATATHTPPSGTALDLEPEVDEIHVNVLVGPFTVPGTHFVDIQAEGSQGSKPVVRYQIKVRA